MDNTTCSRHNNCGYQMAHGSCSGCSNAETKPTTTGAIKDSGERREFSTGAVRDIQEGKGRCDLMPLEVVAKYYGGGIILEYIAKFQKSNDTDWLISAMSSFAVMRWGDGETMFLEVAKHFEEGAKKYGENNWQKGLPVNCYIDSAVRHYLKWLRGDEDEPHDRAFVWNLMCCIWELEFSPRAKEKHESDVDQYCKADIETTRTLAESIGKATINSCEAAIKAWRELRSVFNEVYSK